MLRWTTEQWMLIGVWQCFECWTRNTKRSTKHKFFIMIMQSHILHFKLWNTIKQEETNFSRNYPYSPVFSPSDPSLLQISTNKICGHLCSCPEGNIEVYKSHVSASSDWHICFLNYFIQMKKYIDSESEYFEKQCNFFNTKTFVRCFLNT